MATQDQRARRPRQRSGLHNLSKGQQPHTKIPAVLPPSRPRYEVRVRPNRRPARLGPQHLLGQQAAQDIRHSPRITGRHVAGRHKSHQRIETIGRVTGKKTQHRGLTLSTPDLDAISARAPILGRHGPHLDHPIARPPSHLRVTAQNPETSPGQTPQAHLPASHSHAACTQLRPLPQRAEGHHPDTLLHRSRSDRSRHRSLSPAAPRRQGDRNQQPRRDAALTHALALCEELETPITCQATDPRTTVSLDRTPRAVTRSGARRR